LYYTSSVQLTNITNKLHTLKIEYTATCFGHCLQPSSRSITVILHGANIECQCTGYTALLHSKRFYYCKMVGCKTLQ